MGYTTAAMLGNDLPERPTALGRRGAAAHLLFAPRQCICRPRGLECGARHTRLRVA